MKKGFLLFEAMVSVVVITCGILFVIRPLTAAKLIAERSRELLIASILLDNKAQELEKTYAADEGSREGGFSGSGLYVWSAGSAKVKEADFNAVTIKVSRKDKLEQALCSVLIYVEDKSGT